MKGLKMYSQTSSIQMNTYPDNTEKKKLRKYYFRLAWIIIALIGIFKFVNIFVTYICAGIIAGGFSSDEITQGKTIIYQSPVMNAVHTYGFPLAGDIAAFSIGILITKLDLKKRLSFKGFTGIDLCKMTSLSFGLSTIASFFNVILIAIIVFISSGFSGLTADSAVNAANMTASDADNPLWLNVLIYLYICIIGPVFEELVFRGVLLEGLRKYGNAFGIIMSAALFGLSHQNAMQCIPAFSIGLIWAAMTIKSGSLIPSMFVHIFSNSLSAILMILMNYVHIIDNGNYIEALTSSIPFITAVSLNALLRLGCIIASIVITAQFFSNRKTVFQSNEYCRNRTWGFIFTSLPWILIILYTTFETIISISL